MLKGRVFRHSQHGHRIPKEHDILMTLKLIERYIPMDEQFSLAWGKSQRSVTRLRCECSTNNMNWWLDMYHGNFFQVKVSNRVPTVSNSPLAAVLNLCVQLGVKVNLNAHHLHHPSTTLQPTA